MRKCAEFSQAVHAVTRQRSRQSSALRIVPKASHGLAGTESKPGVPGAPDSDGLALFGEERRAERELGQRLRLAVRDVLVIHASVPVCHSRTNGGASATLVIHRFLQRCGTQT